MSYAIMRCKKLATIGSVASSLKHAYRERETANADPERTPENEHRLASNTDEAMGKLRELLPEKRRKDAVLAVEYFLGASPEWWKQASQEQQQQFFDQAQDWLVDKYGADRVITASIHRDETSPHMTAFVVPLTKDGRLSAKEFIGNKAQMSLDQTTFAERMRDLGLERGLEGSKARHTTIQQYYARANAAMPLSTPAIDLPDAKLLEGKETYGRRVAEAVIAQVAPELTVLRAKAQQTMLAEQRSSVAEQRQRQAELHYQQRENLLQVERDKAKVLAEKHKELMQVIARGGAPLEKMQASFRERIELGKAERQRVRGGQDR